MPFNINGRICIAFSFFWGILAIYLMSYLNPKIDELIDKIKTKISIKLLKTIVIYKSFYAFTCEIVNFELWGRSLKFKTKS